MTMARSSSWLELLKSKFGKNPLNWLILGSVGCLFCLFLVQGLPLPWAINLHAYGSYYFCVLLFGSLIYTTAKVIRTVNVSAYLCQRWKGLVFVLFASVFVHLFQPHIMRIYNDEPAHQMVAKMMHLERENSVPEVAYAQSNTLDYGLRSLNYRMYFYPFLVSILHDLSGFRPVNGLILNGFIGVALFLVVYMGGNRIHPKGGGILAVALLLSLPLLDETVTSYSYDVTNLFFLAALFLALSHYVEQRRPELLNWTVMLAIGLAYSRNESVLYLIVVILVFGVLLLRDPQVTLTRMVAFSPLLLLPVLAAKQIFEELTKNGPHAGAGSTQGNGPVLSLDYIPENLIQVGSWMFDFSSTVASSPFLTLIGVTGLLALLVCGISKLIAKEGIRPIDWTILVFALGILGPFVFITLALFWSPVSGEAVRFLLPIHLLFTYAGVWFMANTKQAERNFPPTIGLTVLVIVLLSVPTKTREVRAENLAFAKYAAWAVDWIEENQNHRYLYLSQLNTLFLLHGQPTIDLARGGSEIEKVGQLVAENYYSSALVFIIERYDAAADNWAPASPAMPLNPRVIAEVVDERRWAFNQRARFLRVTGFLNAEGQPVYLDELRPMKNDFDNFGAYWNAMRQLHPGLAGN